jgi:hypothetical protein
MPYDCEPVKGHNAGRRLSARRAATKEDVYVRALIIILTLAIAGLSGSTVVAQEGYPMKGSWVGEWGPSKVHSDDLLLVLNWDGKAITGMVNPGTDNIPIKSATLTPPASAPGDWIVRIQFDGKDAKGGVVSYSLEGKIDNLALHNRTVTGTWKSASETGKFKIQRQ